MNTIKLMEDQSELAENAIWFNTFKVALICVGMFSITMISGFVPSTMSCLSERNKHIIAIYGAGILVGTALLVVMPESVKVIIDSDAKLRELNHEDNIMEKG